MKILLTGASGSIGNVVLSTLLSNRTVTSVIAPTRRPLTLTNAKLINPNVPDFSNYPDHFLTHLDNLDAVIWCIGTYNGDTTIEVKYPEALHDAILARPACKQRSEPLRWVLLGGAFTVPDQDAKLWFMPQARQVRGLQQSVVLDWQAPDWTSVVVRPAAVVGEGWLWGSLAWVFGQGLCVSGRELSEVMLEEAARVERNGDDGKGSVVLNREIVRRGRALLMAQA